ncbi:hypothetical protein TH25_10665 [Thalassospira profundimaris]|uniref:Uncharacterized protein n=1 Tax=Thalassospira profundimaris TaxID=502049 RepID=A0A367XAP7_9PROT|nr:hypothetical protein TH25_10665 [Thalassospira profundimaris]|tara:strand:- start:156 stop:338 length:183 start_codon:yes stop_codon:yes gene_type:complete
MRTFPQRKGEIFIFSSDLLVLLDPPLMVIAKEQKTKAKKAKFHNFSKTLQKCHALVPAPF